MRCLVFKFLSLSLDVRQIRKTKSWCVHGIFTRAVMDLKMSSFEREPSKRKIKRPSQPLLELEFGESSDDSDFNIEDHHEGSDDDSFNTDDDDNFTDDEEGSESDENREPDAIENEKKEDGKTVSQLIEQANVQFDPKAVDGVLICCACLGDRSDHTNEIVECDSCGVTVHEGCYGVSDSMSVSSTESLSPTEPWFCEACRAGVTDPSCELCPNKGGIFKATDVGRWVHLICALYVPGVAFGEVERLSNVTLFEMPYNKWGAKMCVLCEDERLARTGVNIGCDAGMCRTFFHVTCAQREGLLSEAHSEEVDQADPFYAHCKLHTDKSLMRRRRRNYIVMQYINLKRAEEHAKEADTKSAESLRIQKKLAKKREKYLIWKNNAPQPWVPTQKMPRLLTTSASVCRELWRKAELMGIDSVASETKETRAAVLSDISKKWHIPPAFSFEFTGYFLDRNNRIPAMKKSLEDLLAVNKKLSEEQDELKQKYEQSLKVKQEVEAINTNLRQTIEKYHTLIRYVVPDKRLPVVEDLMIYPRATHPLSATMLVPTAAALKAGVGYPIARTNYKGQQQTEPRIHSKQHEQSSALTTHECGICHSNRDQHLLAKCDTCYRYYHLGCLNPPLTRMPKKTKLMGWQCSECDRESNTSAVELDDVEAPRKLRHSKEDSRNSITSASPRLSNDFSDDKSFNESTPRSKGGKKRRREKHERYSPELLGSSKKHKKKKKNPKVDNLPRIKIK
ncbi:UNVERIFIED_CONTAM: hypothetical protein PYX00_001976 [Menopon gallinae]